ncbi:MAG: 3-keto-disaccharide hydrolase [Polaribacter sp.]
MKKYILGLLFSFLLLGCQENSRQQKVTIKAEEIKQEPTKPEETEIWKPKPKKVTIDPKTKIPSDAIILFDGTNFDEWTSSKDSTAVKWMLNKDGSTTVKDKTGDIQTKRNFGSIQLHIEWRSSAEIRGNGQSRSNSGIFLQNRYEIQVLDNNDNDTYVNGQVGSIYKQSIPLVNPSSKTGDWNTFDVIYHAPIFDSRGSVSKHGTITVLHNGVLIQDHFKIKGTTEYVGWPKNNTHNKAPIKLQDHHDNSGVSYRNIWVRELNE